MERTYLNASIAVPHVDHDRHSHFL